MRKIAFSVLALLLSVSASAYKKQVIKVNSASMSKDVPVTVILPDNYDGQWAFPVVYLLHGHSGNNEDWDKYGLCAPLADQHNVILVLPDGGHDSWYWDSTETPEYQYETFTSKELVKYVDENFKTIPDRTMRAISGLSMGGQGALYLAIRHQDTFASCGSISGGVDIRPFPDSWGMKTRLGSIEKNPEEWDKHCIVEMVDQIQKDSLRIAIDCGVSDFFHDVNLNLHNKLLEAGISHDYTERPGSHNWDYWVNAVRYQVLFFSTCFKNPR